MKVACYALLMVIVLGQNPQNGNDTPEGRVMRAAAAHGGKWTSGEIADSVAEGKLTFFTKEGPKATFDLTLLRKGSTQVQRIIVQPAGPLKQGTDGTRSWESMAGFFTPVAQGPALHFIESQTNRSLQSLFNFANEHLTLRDRGESGKNRVIEAEDAHGRKTNYHIDNDSSVVTRLEFVIGQAKDPFSGRIVDRTDAFAFSDYRSVQGVLSPHHIERFNDGIKTEDMQFTSIRYNAGLHDQDFRR